MEVGFVADVSEEYAYYVISFDGVKCPFETSETQPTTVNVGSVSAFNHRERFTLPNNSVIYVYYHKYTSGFMLSTPSCQILTKLEFSGQIFEKYSNIKFHNPSSGSRVIPRGWTDGQTDMTKPIVNFRNFAKAPKI
jgi:hypothetical protein